MYFPSKGSPAFSILIPTLARSLGFPLATASISANELPISSARASAAVSASDWRSVGHVGGDVLRIAERLGHIRRLHRWQVNALGASGDGADDLALLGDVPAAHLDLGDLFGSGDHRPESQEVRTQPQDKRIGSCRCLGAGADLASSRGRKSTLFSRTVSSYPMRLAIPSRNSQSVWPNWPEVIENGLAGVDLPGRQLRPLGNLTDSV